MRTISEILAEELGQKLEYIENVITLIDEGNTIPFIARYRKEMHGAMDDTTLRDLETRLTYLRNLQQRKDEVKRSIENQGKLTPELMDAIDAAATMAEVTGGDITIVEPHTYIIASTYHRKQTLCGYSLARYYRHSRHKR